MTTPAAQNSPPLRGYGFTLKEPGLYDVLMVFKRQMFLSLNCVQIGTIQSFDAAKRTAAMQIVFKQVLKDGTTQNYPQLINCPVFTLQGGGAAVSLPIAVGDTALVLFCDRNLDTWATTGSQQPPADGRLHDISDGIALVGLNWSGDATIPAVVADEASLNYGGAKVALSGGLVAVKNSSQSLLTILNNLLSALENLTTTNAVAGSPCTLSPATITALQNIGTALGELLQA